MASVEFKGGKKLTEHLHKIAERVGRAESVSVGFMKGAEYPNGTPVAYVAAIQNYGAPAAGIPPRPFFSNMVKIKSPEYGGRLGRILKETQFDGILSLKRMGDSIGGELQDSIESTDQPPLKAETVKRKGFAKPLIDTGHMQNSVQYEVDDQLYDMPARGDK